MNNEKKSLECELVSWHSTVKLSYKLAAMIKHDGFSPDIVIAIARGGYVPARIICDRLDIYDLASIRITHYTGGSSKQEQARLSIPLSIDISGMSVLLVDDVDDTGDWKRPEDRDPDVRGAKQQHGQQESGHLVGHELARVLFVEVTLGPFAQTDRFGAAHGQSQRN